MTRIKKARHRKKHVPGVMNRTELVYSKLLDSQKLSGEIVDWKFEPFKFRLGKDWKLTYTPDFMVLRADGEIEIVDVKGGGGWEEDARVKIKIAAEIFPMFHWIGAKQSQPGARFERELF